MHVVYLGYGAHSHGLDDLCMRYFQHENIAFKDVIQHAPKDGRKDGNFSGVPLSTYTYAAEDALMTLRLFLFCVNGLRKKNFIDLLSHRQAPIEGLNADGNRQGKS